MSASQPLNFDPARVETPAYVVDLSLLKKNLELLAHVQEQSGAKVLLALKGFSMFSTFDLVRQYLSGCCASGLHEALLARQEFNREVHVYAPAFKESEMKQIIPIADHISFNSYRQWRTWKPMLDAARAAGLHAPSPGIRVNPEHSEVEVALYDPCSPGCRLGTRADALEHEDLEGLEGLHFHALCEQDSDVLERTLAAVEKRFPWLLEKVKWVNMGGGHHITRPGYDTDRLIRVVRDFKARWGKDVYLEPGEAIALNTGFLVVSVMDVVGTPVESKVVIKAQSATVDHVQDQPSSLRYRTQADSNRAARELHQSLQDVGGGFDSADAGQRIIAETQSILEWAGQNGWLIEPAALARITRRAGVLEGASEHDVFLDRDAGRVLKITRPPNFGARGTAAAYLENLLACQAFFGVDWHFEGVVMSESGLHLLSSQSFVVGSKATDEEIAAYLAGLGFVKVRENTYQRTDGLRIADARPDNVLKDEAGMLYAIDVHVLGLRMDEIPEDEDSESASPLPTAILDTSATCHMPDTLEMPYRPHIIGSGKPGEFPYTYKLGGMSCLAGDVINEYSFPQPLELGQKLVFTDMAHYTMVKTTTFNGVPHPDIDTYDPETDELRVVRRFGYQDFKRKLS